jgi:nucleotide-binding universal stress UspA family protein
MALETVLLAVGDERDRVSKLANTAVDIAGPAGATVEIAHVFTREEYRSVREKLDIDPDSEQTPHSVARRHTSTRELGEAFDGADVEYDINGRIGDHGDEIVDLAEELDADLVIVGGRKRSPTGKAVFGSTAQEVLLESPCPVAFVRAD